MDLGMVAFVGLVITAALAAFARYRWRMRVRARWVEGLVKDCLVGRFTKSPGGLHVDCSDDELWPVLAAFDDPATGARRRFRFSCSGPRSSLVLLSEGKDTPPAAPASVEARESTHPPHPPHPPDIRELGWSSSPGRGTVSGWPNAARSAGWRACGSPGDEA